jgi:hypothetical protein
MLMMTKTPLAKKMVKRLDRHRPKTKTTSDQAAREEDEFGLRV